MPVAESSFSTPTVIYPSSVGSTLLDRISYDGRNVKMDSATNVKFSMRTVLSRTPSINAANAVGTVPDSLGHNVAYIWQAGNLDVEGQYMGWWSYTLGGGEYETPEFPLIISDHGPGLGTRIGAIVDGAAAYLPTTFAALRREETFGDRRLQHFATMVQLRVFGSSVDPDLEATTYALPLLDYLSKRVAYDLITPGIDYWSRQVRTVTTQGPTEIASYPDMLKSLDDLRAQLRAELKEDWADLQLLVPGLAVKNVIAMPVSDADPFYKTLDPRYMQPQVFNGACYDYSFFAPFP